jgi:hypothetical protein
MLTTPSCIGALMLIASACATQSSTGRAGDPSTTAAPRRAVRDPLVISQEELRDEAIAGRDAMNAIRQLRPAFFMDRGPRSMPRNSSAAAQARAAATGKLQVSQDFGPLQPVTALNNLEIRTLLEVRYLDAIAAQARFGINANSGPVVVLLSSRQ